MSPIPGLFYRFIFQIFKLTDAKNPLQNLKILF